MRIKLYQALALAFAFGATSVFAQPKQDKPKDQPKPDTTTQSTPADPDKGLTGNVEIQEGIVHGERDSAKFEEYRDLSKGSTGTADLRYKDGDRIVSVKANQIGKKDQQTTVTVNQAGTAKLTLDYNQTPHNYAYDAQVPFFGVGSGFLLLSPADKAGLIPGANVASSANGAQRDRQLGQNMLNWELGMPANVDISLLRKKGTVKLELSPLEALTVNMSWSQENRDGTRPYTMAMGSSAFMIELPEPIDYTTSVARLNAEYVTKKVYANASYTASRFENHITALVVDNPLAVTDSNVTTLSFGGTSLTGNQALTLQGPAKARQSLSPNSMMQSIDGTLQLRDLPMKSQLTLYGSAGFMRQDDALLPYTSNTAITIPNDTRSVFGVPFTDATSVYTLPRQTAEAGADILTGQAKFTSEPISHLHVRLKYDIYDYKTTTKEWLAPGYVDVDGKWSTSGGALPGASLANGLFMGAPINNEPQGYAKRKASGDVHYDLWSGTNLGLGYSEQIMTREAREVKEQEEDTLHVTLDSKLSQLLEVRLTGTHSHRAGDYEFYEPGLNLLSNPQILNGVFNGNPATASQVVGTNSVSTMGINPPYLRKYDEANRKRDDGNLLVTLTPSEELTVSVSGTYGKDSFYQSAYGLQSDWHSAYSADADYLMKAQSLPEMHIHGFAITEDSNTKQKDRSTSATGVGSEYFGPEAIPQYSSSDWTAESKDHTNTYGLGYKIALIANKLDLDLNVMETVHNGSINYKTPLGDPAAYLNSVSAVGAGINQTTAPTTTSGSYGNPLGNADGNNAIYLNQDKTNDYKYRTVKVKLTYKIDTAMSITAGALFEKFDYADFYTNQFAYVPITQYGYWNGGVFMGALPKAYNANYEYVKFTYKF